MGDGPLPSIVIPFWQVCARLDKVLMKEGLMLICEEEKVEYFLVDLKQAKKVDKPEIEKMARERKAIEDYETVVHG
jgi:hypothetical protein